MDLLGHGPETGALRLALDRETAASVALSGPQGCGATSLALAATGELRRIYHRVPPLTEPQQRAALARTLAEVPGTHQPLGAEAEWADLLRRAEGDGAQTTVLIVDDAHRLHESRARFMPALRTALGGARKRGRRFHVVMVAPEQPTLDEAMEQDLVLVRLALGPLPFRSALPALPGSDTDDLLRAYAVFGGAPGRLALLDPDASLNTNLRRLVLDPQAPLVDDPVTLVERHTQAPSRYMAILQTLSRGEADWGSVHAGVPDVTASGQVAPYLKRLDELGLVEARRSLDAGPRSRNRRYRILDPWLAFWFRFVFPHRGDLPVDGPDAVTEAIRAELDDHVAMVLPEVCRQYMRHDALEILASNARECGSLWGSGYDIPVAGILGNGAAFYGAVVPPRSDGIAELGQLDRAIRETRYGFGRERRLRLLFTRGEAPSALVREAARRHDVWIVDGAALRGQD